MMNLVLIGRGRLLVLLAVIALVMACYHAPATVDALKGLGHDVDVWPQFPAENAGVCAIMVHPETGQKHAGADPRREGYAGGW